MLNCNKNAFLIMIFAALPLISGEGKHSISAEEFYNELLHLIESGCKEKCEQRNKCYKKCLRKDFAKYKRALRTVFGQG